MREGLIIIVFLLAVSYFIFFSPIIGPSWGSAPSEEPSNTTIDEPRETNTSDESQKKPSVNVETGGAEEVIRDYLDSYENPDGNLSSYVHPQSPNYNMITLQTYNQTDRQFVRQGRSDIILKNITMYAEKYNNTSLVFNVEGLQTYESLEDERTYGVQVASEIQDKVEMRRYNNTWRIWYIDDFIE